MLIWGKKIYFSQTQKQPTLEGYAKEREHKSVIRIRSIKRLDIKHWNQYSKQDKEEKIHKNLLEQAVSAGL